MTTDIKNTDQHLDAEVSVGEKRKAEQTEALVTKKAALEKPTSKFSNGDYNDLDFVKPKFSPNLFDDSTREQLKKSIEESGPYKHGVIRTLMNDELLNKVYKEIMDNLHFTKKETDIYKVFQTGDLRNLSGLDESELSKLSSLYQLREALYSKPFREYLAYVTGSGALSGTKQDLSINVYQQGCHLLNHDDVIGSRRISYILYLPDPTDPAGWEYPKNGGALRLYPTERLNVPANDWTLEIPPVWNQMAFFTVQPGLSFHDVEEVFVNRPRLSISGWFHIPQEGEEGYIEGELEDTQAKSSLQQLESDELQEYDFPKKVFVKVDEQEVEEGKRELDNFEKQDEEREKKEEQDQSKNGVSETAATEPSHNEASLESYLSSEDITELSKFINPGLLKPSALSKLTTYFLSESAVEIREFLNNEYAGLLKHAINGVDMDDEDHGIKVPYKSTDIKLPWKLAGPPHKFRYMYLDGRESYETETLANEKQQQLHTGFISSADSQDVGASFDLEKLGVTNNREKDAIIKLNELSEFIKSKPFRNWLRVVCRLNPIASRVLVRRFRPSLDYTLATGLNKIQHQDQDEEIQMLEATLSLTPTKGWVDGELGGYELYLAVEEEDKDANLDPAVYRGTKKPSSEVTADGGDSYGKSSQADDDDSVLLTTQAEWNVLSLVVRDEGILKFVKYVSGNAPGSRWDLSAEWRVEKDEDQEDEDQEDEDQEDAN